MQAGFKAESGEKMRKLTAILLCLTICMSLAACGGQENESNNLPEQNSSTVFTSLNHTANGDSNILIAYFTWAENTHVENPDAVDVDATTSASVLLPGNAGQNGGWIQERTGGDLFSIVVTEPYSSDYDECLDRAADEKAKNARPELKNHLENMEDYDIVFLGFPNWWYTVPMAIHSFLEEYDFSDKTIIPFVTHGTGGLASTIEDIKGNLPDSANVLEPIGVYREDVDKSQPAVNEWLDQMGFTETKPDTETETTGSGDNLQKHLTMTVNGQKIEITLYDTPAANRLYAMLPLELNFEDYNNTEKIAYLPEELSTEGEPDSFDPDVGDVCIYAPWGNLSIFYKDFSSSSGLVSIGRIESGLEIISDMNSDFTVSA